MKKELKHLPLQSEIKTKQFYEHNEKVLLDNYPGLSFPIFSNFIRQYLLHKGRRHESLGALDSQDSLFRKLKAGIPFAQLLNEAYFFNGFFYVDSKVLVPRPETELLVEQCLKEIKKLPPSSCIAEVGIGSGAILLSIACEAPAHRYWGGDISSEALEVAMFNYYLRKFPLRHTKVEMNLSDRLYAAEDHSIDFLISNPPYIMRGKDFSEVHPMVAQHEPHVALFLNDQDYFQWFSDFFTQARSKLKVGGIFWLEGHEKHLERLLQLALKMGYTEGVVLKDYTQRDRFLRLKN